MLFLFLQTIPNAVECSTVGDLKCGVCSCHEDFLGDKCHCKKGDSNNQGIDESTCIEPNSKLKCNGQGKCVCGQCQCDNKGDPMQVKFHVITFEYVYWNFYFLLYISHQKIIVNTNPFNKITIFIHYLYNSRLGFICHYLADSTGLYFHCSLIFSLIFIHVFCRLFQESIVSVMISIAVTQMENLALVMESASAMSVSAILGGQEQFVIAKIAQQNVKNQVSAWIFDYLLSSHTFLYFGVLWSVLLAC